MRLKWLTKYSRAISSKRLWFVHFLGCVSLLVSTSAVSCLETLVSEMVCYLLSGTLYFYSLTPCSCLPQPVTGSAPRRPPLSRDGLHNDHGREIRKIWYVSVLQYCVYYYSLFIMVHSGMSSSYRSCGSGFDHHHHHHLFADKIITLGKSNRTSIAEQDSKAH